MESKLSKRFKEKSLYNIIANNVKTGFVEIFERNLTYEQVCAIDAAGYSKTHLKYRNFRVQRVTIPKVSVVHSRVRTHLNGKCQECGKEFYSECSAKHHVSVFHHTVTMSTHYKTVFSPES